MLENVLTVKVGEMTGSLHNTTNVCQNKKVHTYMYIHPHEPPQTHFSRGLSGSLLLMAGAACRHARLIYIMVYFACVSLSTEQKQTERSCWGSGRTIWVD